MRVGRPAQEHKDTAAEPLPSPLARAASSGAVKLLEVLREFQTEELLELGRDPSFPEVARAAIAALQPVSRTFASGSPELEKHIAHIEGYLELILPRYFRHQQLDLIRSLV